MQYAKYPTKIMNITQNYTGATSHNDAYIGIPRGYQIDDNCGSTGRDYFYAPYDGKFMRIYGVGNSGTNTIWFESIDKIKCADGTESFLCTMVIHPNDDTLKDLKLNQVYKQGTPLFLEGKDGNATGYHFHIEVSKSKFSGNGWSKNSKKAWVINKGVKLEDVFFVDKSFTTIKSSSGLKFKDLPKATEPKVNYYPKYTGKSNSYSTALKELKITNSFSYRQKVAKANGMNLTLLNSWFINNKCFNLLKIGKLIKP